MPYEDVSITFVIPGELHAKVIAWAAEQDRSIRASLTRLLRETVGDVDARKPDPTAAIRAVEPRPMKPPQRQARPIELTVAEAHAFLADDYRLRDPDKMYAARIRVGGTEDEALAFMRREYDPMSLGDPYEPPVIQSAWLVRDAPVADDGGSEFVLDPDAAYIEHRANGLSHEQAIERVQWSCECNGVTGWVPPQNEEPV